METGREQTFSGTLQEGRGFFKEMEGKTDRQIGRSRRKFGGMLSRLTGNSNNGVIGGILAFSLTLLAASMLLFPNMRMGVGRRVGFYKTERTTDRFGRWFGDLLHGIGIGR